MMMYLDLEIGIEMEEVKTSSVGFPLQEGIMEYPIYFRVQVMVDVED